MGVVVRSPSSRSAALFLPGRVAGRAEIGHGAGAFPRLPSPSGLPRRGSSWSSSLLPVLGFVSASGV